MEVRTFEGDAGEIARFTQHVWQSAYRSKIPTPVWDEDFFDWQLLSEDSRRSGYLVAAYDGGQLVGSLFAEEFLFRLHDVEFSAALSSWLAVHPGYQRRGVGRRLAEEQRRRLRERGAKFLLGFGIREKESSGPKFWMSFCEETVILGRLGMWARLLDHRAVAEWDVRCLEGLSARLLGALQRPAPARRPAEGVREYRPEDLPDCLALVNASLGRVDMGCVWGSARLARQLQYKGIPRTLVAESAEGRAEGFINYYPLGLLGRTHLRAGIIDILATHRLSWRRQRDLLSAALSKMYDEGLKLALALRLPTSPGLLLLGSGFVPLPSGYDVICHRADTSLNLAKAKRLSVYLR